MNRKRDIQRRSLIKILQNFAKKLIFGLDSQGFSINHQIKAGYTLR